MAATAAALVALKEKERKLRREADFKLRAIFKSIDEDGSGQLDEGEMLNALANIGFDKQDPAIIKRVRDAAGEDHEISFSEFKDSITMLADSGALDVKFGLRPETWATRFVPLPYREQAHAFYNSGAVQVFVASVIIFNFFAIIVEKELDPAKEPEFQLHYGVWRGIDNGACAHCKARRRAAKRRPARRPGTTHACAGEHGPCRPNAVARHRPALQPPPPCVLSLRLSRL